MTTSSSQATKRSEGKKVGAMNWAPTVRLTVAACLVFWIFVFADSGWTDSRSTFQPVGDLSHGNWTILCCMVYWLLARCIDWWSDA